MDTEKVIVRDNDYVLHTYKRNPIVIERGHGMHAYGPEGQDYLDFTSGIGVNSLGYCDLDWADAVARQAHKLQHTSNLYYTEPCIQAAKLLCEKSGMKKAFFGNSGAEANEGVIKAARKYSFLKYGASRNKIIALQNSFHGRTITTLNATGQEKFHQYFFPFTEGFDYAVANDIENLKSKIDNTTCAVMMELIQGEGGVLPLDKEFVKQVETICNEKDLLLIIDEVQTGIGRTGSLFCFQQYDIKPDVVTMAKGLGGGVPIGAVMASKKCCDVLGPGMHATTFGGTPTVCAAANAVLEIVNNDEFLAEVNKKGEYIKQGILSIGSDKITDVRGMGLMIGIIVDADKRAEYVNECIANGLLVLTAGTNTIRLLPPLTISYEELDEAISVFKKVFA